ncbi:ShlB/FhaC/HecB family hemolysin secretion/activation protein [Puniceibacterium sediminis]|uniref:Hemolysin activation/secretion protein n=1 Tax=Puniceibacterium sediminis TaxID=1608407 RepID=A0A238WDS8_9RHOB|nr:ShlB/FhaC/HecB family hemolysin secretion/activation protein [Puniceibacterium sediminis]SNR44715.1 hemolysin activation/secretion protein [Puniceibacterium sediminis]
MMRAWFPAAILSATALTCGSASQAQEADAGERLWEEVRRTQALESLAGGGPGHAITSDETPGVVAETPCFPIDNIELSGFTVFASAHFTPLLAEFSGRCLGQVSINNLLGGISAIYADAGYITTRAYVPAQDISGRQLQVEVIEGRIEAFEYIQLDKDGQQRDAPRRKILTAMPQAEGDVFQLRDLEHGLEQMNRLRSTQVNANLTAGEAPGTSRIMLTEKRSDPLRGTFSLTRQSGEEGEQLQISSRLEVDDLLRLNDSWSLALSGSRDSNALALSMSLPWKRWLFSAAASYSEELSVVSPTADLLTQTATVNLSAERIVLRTARSNYFTYARLSSYWNERFINVAELTPQHRSALSFGLRQEHRMESWLFSADTALSFGVGWLGADRDAGDMARSSPRTDYTKLETRLTYIRPFEDGRQLSVYLLGQMADVPLYGNEQLSIGGWETVRGYSGGSVSGESGAYLRAELTFPTDELDFTRFGQDIGDTWRNPFRRAFGGIRTFAFLDAGRIQNRAGDFSVDLLGAGAGVSAQLGIFTVDGALAFPLVPHAGRKRGDYEAQLGLSINLF